MDIRKLIDPSAPRQDALDALGRLGFGEPAKALANLKYMASGVDDPLLLGLLAPLVKASARSADPDGCLNSFERISGASESRADFLGTLSWHPDAVKLMAPLLASSRFLTTFLTGDPEGLLGWLFTPGRLNEARTKAEQVREALSLCPRGTGVTDAMERLRNFKYREFLRITVRDLTGWADLAETTLELSNLADAALEAALNVASEELDSRFGMPRYETPNGGVERCPFTVIAMGKHGGRELNFSSDIDIMYLYLTDKGETSGPRVLTNHQYFVKLGELITRITGEISADGFVFRVDLRLRPEGERGDLAQNLLGYEIYYESWGQPWERSALIKARPCAGDMDLGRAFIEMVRPFVFRKYLDYASIGEVREMKERIEMAAQARAAKHGREVNLKLGAGGIREIEFFISALQLLYGGREPALRERNSLKALHRLAMKDLISFDEQDGLAHAYEFLRTAEHRIQLVDERQTQSFADEPGERRALAMRMGFRDAHGKDAGDLFASELHRHMSRVRDIYDGLLVEQAVGMQEKKDELELLLSLDVTAEEAEYVLAKEGFRDPRNAFRNVLLLRDGSAGSSLTPRSRSMFVTVIPLLISGCAASPDPDMAINNLESFVASYGSREALVELINGRPESAGLITRLFGSSEYFSRMLITRPEMTDTLLFSGGVPLPRSKEELAAELAGWLSSEDGMAGKMDAMRKFKHAEEIRVGLRDLYEDPGYRAVANGLVDMAEVVLDAVLDIAYADTASRYGYPGGRVQAGGTAVVGLGKLGGRELIYGSDLDIFFIHEKGGRTSGPEKISGPEFYSRLAERVLYALSSLTREGFVFRVDTRLRPGGSKGVLSHTLDSLKKYYMNTASLWELQALTRSRAVAGDNALRDGYEALRTEILSMPRDRDTLGREVLAMRMRIEKELGRAKGGLNIKHGAGGIVDVEFIVQYLQLQHWADIPELAVPDTAAALDALACLDLIPEGGGGVIKESYGFFRELESKIRIFTGQSDSVLPEDGKGLAILAARMGYGNRGEDAPRMLVADYRERAMKVREVFMKVMGVSA